MRQSKGQGQFSSCNRGGGSGTLKSKKEELISRKGKAPIAEGGQAQLARRKTIVVQEWLEEGKPQRLMGGAY